MALHFGADRRSRRSCHPKGTWGNGTNRDRSHKCAVPIILEEEDFPGCAVHAKEILIRVAIEVVVGRGCLSIEIMDRSDKRKTTRAIASAISFPEIDFPTRLTAGDDIEEPIAIKVSNSRCVGGGGGGGGVEEERRSGQCSG